MQAAAAVCLPMPPGGAEAIAAAPAGGGAVAFTQPEGLMPFAALLKGLAPADEGGEDGTPAPGGREESEKLAEGGCADVCALLMQLPGGAAGQQVEPTTAPREVETLLDAAALPAAGVQAVSGADCAASACGAVALPAARAGLEGAFAMPDGLPEGIAQDASGQDGVPEPPAVFRPGGSGGFMAEKAVAGIVEALRTAADQGAQTGLEARPIQIQASGAATPRPDGAAVFTAGAAGPEAAAKEETVQRAPGGAYTPADAGQKVASDHEAGATGVSASPVDAESEKTPTAVGESVEPFDADERVYGEGRNRDEVRRAHGAGGDVQAESGVMVDRQNTAQKTGGISRSEKVSAAERALLKFADDLRGIGGGEREIRIVLEPESLGTLEISVVKTEKGVTAKIRSGDREICAAISESLKGLAASLEARGVAVHDLNVEYLRPDLSGGFPQGAGSRAGGGSNGGGGRPAQRWQDAEKDGDAVFFGFDVPTAGDGVSVEYRV